MHSAIDNAKALQAPRVGYSMEPVPALLDDRQTLAVFDFGMAEDSVDPRLLTLPLKRHGDRPLCEVWHVDGPVDYGRDGNAQWAASADWLFLAVRQPDSGGDILACARQAYATLTGWLGEQRDWQVQRLWNYLDDINVGDGDAERYRRFCAGRLQGMGHFFADGFPAATAIGHPQAAGQLELYCLASRAAGHRIENPRQLSAWRYPRQYGPVSPSFARAMRLPDNQALALSGTAAIRGHASRHDGDLEAQLDETLTNLHSLLQAADMPGTLGAHSPLKVYVRHADDLPRVDAILANRLPDTPRLLLQADICRRELLVEIDGWHFLAQ